MIVCAPDVLPIAVVGKVRLLGESVAGNPVDVEPDRATDCGEFVA